jgi:ribosomal protein L37AE/L43A
MQGAYERVMATPGSLLRPWAMDPEKDGTLTCPTCLGVADYWPEEEAFICRRCGAKAAAAGYQPIGV